MRRHLWIGFAAAAILVLALSACSPAAATPAGGAPQPDSGAAQPTTAGAAPTTAAAAPGTCVSVDTAQLMAGGQTLYAENCAGCHGEQGEGSGDFPALSDNQVMTGNDVVALVTNYFAVDAHPKTLTVEQLSSLFTYARSSFGNAGTVICPEDITIPAAP